MRVVPFLLIVLFAALQGLIAAYWIKAGAARSFASVLERIYGTLPSWSALAFSFGWYWLAMPVAGIAWLLLAWMRKTERRRAWTVCTASMLVFLAMVYAMYPLHLMLAAR
jgi:hypothetical protein